MYQDVEIDILELRERLRYDCVAILSFYLEDELTLEVPELHEEIWTELVDIIRRVNLDEWVGHIQKLFCVPRGHAKSTITKLAVILFLRYSRLKFALYVSLTSPIAKQACKDIFNWLTSDKDQLVYGRCTVHKRNESEGLWQFTIGTPDYGNKFITLKSLGTDSQVRGTLIDNNRPELVVIDDCEDNDTASSAESQTKIDTWLMGNLLKATARRSVRIWLGNMINSRTMLFRNSKDKEWNPTVYGAIVRDKVTKELRALWPGMHSVESLLKEYRDYRAKGVGHVWIYEMMNMTNDTVFRTGMGGAVRMPRFNPDEITQGFITVDPAFGQNSWNDYTGLTVHVKVQNQVIPWIVETRKDKYTEDQMLDALLEMSYYWNLTTWVIEANAAQKLLIPLFKLLLASRGIPDHVFLMIPINAGGKQKQSRIFALSKSVAAGSYGVVEEEEEFMGELSLYDPESEEHEDRIDSAAYGPIAWETAGTLIREAMNVHVAMSLLGGDGDYAENVNQTEYVPY